jgi:aryl-alcohol dehydrogenase-like predicted oxidoreductase
MHEAEELLLFLVDHGVSTFHSSHEYESHSYFCSVLERVKRLRPRNRFLHIAKVGVPHFDEKHFRGDRFRAIVESQLRDLNTERIDIVQWLVRQTPNEDAARLAVFREGFEEVIGTLSDLRDEGKVGVLVSFPYTTIFADEILKYDFCSGLIAYLNPGELEYAPHLDWAHSEGKGFVAIRPLFGGKLSRSLDPEYLQVQRAVERLNDSPKEVACFCFAFPLWHPAVAS